MFLVFITLRNPDENKLHKTELIPTYIMAS